MNFLENMLNKIKEYFRRRTILKMHKFCSEKRHLTRWENNFIKSIKGDFNLSEKQYKKLLEIYKTPDISRLRGHNPYVIDDEWEVNSDPRYCDKHGVSYDDVHDFDK